MHEDICVCMVCILILRCVFLSWNARLVSPFTPGPHIPRGMLTSHIRHLLACCCAGERWDANTTLPALIHAVHADKSMFYLPRSTGCWMILNDMSFRTVWHQDTRRRDLQHEHRLVQISFSLHGWNHLRQIKISRNFYKKYFGIVVFFETVW